jgi:hypothetical protein
MGEDEDGEWGEDDGNEFEEGFGCTFSFLGGNKEREGGEGGDGGEEGGGA